MAPPEDLAGFKSDVVDVIIQHLSSSQGNALVHCRGGVGRAGLVTCCVLSSMSLFSNHKKIIEFVRKRRDKRCVESRKQEDFVEKYFLNFA
jgi:protein-tyrosine phosphatase